MALNPEEIARAEELGSTFVREYYNLLTNDADKLLQVYDEDSVFSRGEASREIEERRTNSILVGLNVIDGKLRKIADELGSGEYKIRACHIDSQPTISSSVLVVVSGYILVPSTAAARRFYHTFVLVPVENGDTHYIRNECFRWFPAEDIADHHSVPVPHATAAVDSKHAAAHHADPHEAHDVAAKPKSDSPRAIESAPASQPSKSNKTKKGKQHAKESSSSVAADAAESATTTTTAHGQHEPSTLKGGDHAADEGQSQGQAHDATHSESTGAPKPSGGVRSFKDILSGPAVNNTPAYRVSPPPQRPSTPPPSSLAAAAVHGFILKGVPSKATDDQIRTAVLAAFDNKVRILSVRNKADPKGVAFVDLDQDVLKGKGEVFHLMIGPIRVGLHQAMAQETPAASKAAPAAGGNQPAQRKSKK